MSIHSQFSGSSTVVFAVYVIALIVMFVNYVARRNKLVDEIVEAGESVLIKPEYASYLGKRTAISFKVAGTIVLTNRRIILRKPIGADQNITLDSVTDVKNTERFGGYRDHKAGYLVLEVDRSSEMGFEVDNPEEWCQIISANISRGNA